MGGFNACQAISPIVSHEEFGTPILEAISGGAGTVCAVVKNINDHLYGRKQCNGHKTPYLTWIPLKFRADINDYAYDLDIWVGWETNTQGKTCLWAGVDGGPDTEICVRSAECYSVAAPLDAVASLVEDLLNELLEAADDGSVIDLILKAVFALVLAVLVVVFVAILVEAAPIIIGGALLGGVLVGAG